MEQRSVKGVNYFIADGFNASGANAIHAFTTRIGGVSSAPFNTLDFGGVSGSGLKDRANNLYCIGSVLGVDPLRCALVEQVHGDTIVRLDSVDAKTLERTAQTKADAIVTATPGVAIGILTADCLPILLHDPVTGTVAAVHAGWRGTFLSIVKKTVLVMVKEYGVRPIDIKAAFGPFIGVCCYAVQRDFYEKFLTSFGDSIKGSFIFSTKTSGCNIKGRFGKEGKGARGAVKGSSISFDLQSANRAQLFEAGVSAERIDSVHKCTVCNPDLFFSYRRDVTGSPAERAQTGRMLSLVMATKPAESKVP